MTVITPYQRQLIFTDPDFVSRRRKSRFVFLRQLIDSFSVSSSFVILAVISLTAFFGCCYFAVDSVILGFKIQNFEKNIMAGKEMRSKLELTQSSLMSPDSLKDYAYMIELKNPTLISYQTKN